MLPGERTFFAVATSLLTVGGMMILLVVVIGTFYLLLEYIVEKVRLRIEKKAETDESSEEPAEVRDPEQPVVADGGGNPGSGHDFGLDSQGVLSSRKVDR